MNFVFLFYFSGNQCEIQSPASRPLELREPPRCDPNRQKVVTTSAVLLLPPPSCAFSIDNKACACSSFAFNFWVWWWGCKPGLFYEQPLGHVPIPQNQNCTMALGRWGGKMYKEKYSLLNDITRWRSCVGVPLGCVPRIRFGPNNRKERSCILIGTDGMWHSDWLARESIDSTRAGTSGSSH